MNILKKIIEKSIIYFYAFSYKKKCFFSGLFLILIFSTIFIVLFLINKNIDLQKIQLKKSRQQLNRIIFLGLQYRLYEDQNKKLNYHFKSNNISLFSLIQKIANVLKLDLKYLNERKILSNNDLVEYQVIVNLTKLSIDKLTAFLKATEETKSYGLIKITKLKIKSRFDDSKLLDAEILISTWKAN